MMSNIYIYIYLLSVTESMQTFHGLHEACDFPPISCTKSYSRMVFL